MANQHTAMDFLDDYSLRQGGGGIGHHGGLFRPMFVGSLRTPETRHHQPIFKLIGLRTCQVHGHLKHRLPQRSL